MRKTFFLLIVISAVSVCSGDIITVDDDGPADFNNIQAAIDASSYGDTVQVAAGMYVENITLKNGVELIGAGAENTIIDGNSNGSVVYSNNCDSNTILDGFTITNGKKFDGGGICCKDSSPTIRNNIIIGNFAPLHGDISGFGGGIYCVDSSSVITGNVICNNSAKGRGGGICAIDSTLGLSDNLIAENEALSVWGIFSYPGTGGGISCELSSIEMTNNTITSNCAYDLFLPEAPGEGGGIDCGTSTLTLVNTILWNNSPDEINNRNSNIAITYSEIEGGWAGEGNIDVEPLFADVDANDFHLQSEAGRWDPNTQSWVTDSNTSPCIDAGDPNSDWTMELWPHGKRINMGAYGGTPQASMSLSDAGNIADFDNDGDVDYNDLRLFTEKWPIEQVLLAEDLDRNGKVDFKDYCIFGNEWFNENLGEPTITYEITLCSENPGIWEETEGNRFTVTVDGHYINFEDMMAANCCPAELELVMEVYDDQIIIFEKEYGGSCFCICDYPVEAELGPFESGTYILGVYEDWGGLIGTTTVVIE